MCVFALHMRHDLPACLRECVYACVLTAQSVWLERMAGPSLCQQQKGHGVVIAIAMRELSPELSEELTSHNLC